MHEAARPTGSPLRNRGLRTAQPSSDSRAGAIGGKLLGAGGGGFMLFFARPEFHEKIKSRLGSKLFVPFRFENTGSQIIYFSHD